MTGRRMRQLAGGAVLIALLSACSSGQEKNQTTAVFSGLLDLVTGSGKSGGGTPPSAAQIDKAIGASEDPLALATRVDNGAWSFLIQIEENGDYRTFASPARQTVVFRHGVVTSTRGLGGDLASSDLDGVLPLIRGRQSGQARRIMRFLDGENATRSFDFTCNIKAAEGTETVTSGEIEVAVTSVTESCRSVQGWQIDNVYKVDAEGEVVASSQWLGPTNGDFSIRLLKR
ncbi:hypothetical protein E0K89_006200 [Aquicoccus sp. SCR17]|nr:hypothetical protein [Carideicomes alvinocaridis]